MNFSRSRCITSLFLAPFFALATVAAHADAVYFTSTDFAAATSGVVTTTFGANTPGPGGQLYDNAASSYGAVTLSASSNLHINDPNYYAVHGGFPAYPDGNYLITFGGGSSDTVQVGFPSSTAFSVNLGGTFDAGGFETVVVTLSDGFTYTISTPITATDGISLQFLGFTTDAPVTSATLQFSEDSSNNLYGTFDTVQYGVSAVPEPSSLALLGTGMFSVLGFARSRFRK